MATKETESQRQVKQMVNFIMQEANEKVNEIRIKVVNYNLIELPKLCTYFNQI